MRSTIVMVRHGETDWNRDNRFQGHADPPLNATGRAQALELAAELAGQSIVAAYTSPLRRASATAEIIAERLGLDVRVNDALQEVDVGSWTGLTRGEIAARFPAEFRRWRDGGSGWEDGESYETLGRRVVTALREIAGAHPGESVLVVTHGGPIRSALAAVLSLPFAASRRDVGPVSNCAVVRLAVQEGEFERVD